MEDKVASAAADNNPAKTMDCSEVKAESLSAKIGSLPVLNDSLQTVSKTYMNIKESNSYFKQGLTVVESSVDKAMKAGKSVLVSSTLAPITTRACGNRKLF